MTAPDRSTPPDKGAVRDQEDRTLTSDDGSEVQRFRWSVDGAAVSHGTMHRAYEDSGEIEAEHMGEVLEWLAQKSPVWDVLDVAEAVTFQIEPL